MDLGPAQFLVGDVLVGDGFHHVRPGDVHIAGVAHHEDEVGHRRRIDVAAAQGPMITEICGITPEASTLRWNMSA